VRPILRLAYGLLAGVVRTLLRLVGLTGRLGSKVLVPPTVSRAARLEATGFRRAAQGSGAWFTLSVTLAALRLLGRLGARKREVVWRGELQPGQALRVGHLLEDRAGRPVRRPR